MSIVLIIIASAVSSSLGTLLISEVIGWFKKNHEYKREVRKEFIKRRIESYDKLENVVGVLNLVWIDDDKKRYHFIFTRKASFEQFGFELGQSLKFSFWYSQEIVDLLSELNQIQMGILEPGYDFEDTPGFHDRKVLQGKRMYEPIWKIKEKLVFQIGKDFENMHNIKFSKLFTIK